MSAAYEETPRGLVPRADLYRALARVDELTYELTEERARISEWLGERNRLALQAAGFKRYASVLLAALLAHTNQPLAALSFALRPNTDEDGEVNADNVLKVRVCCTRKDIRNMGGPDKAIICQWGSGYSLSPEGRAWLVAKMKEQAA